METVKTGAEKQQAYKIEYEHFKKALKYEFYLEAVAIGYAIIEDRLVSFLHHAGIVSRTNGKLRINRAVYPYMRHLLKKRDDDSIRIKNISVKRALILALLDMTELDAKKIDEEVADFVKSPTRQRRVAKKGYMSDLYKQMKRTLNSDRLKEVFDQLEPWREDRNQLIHALLNKTTDTSAVAKKECAEKALSLARDFDNLLVKPFKRYNTIRKRYNISS